MPQPLTAKELDQIPPHGCKVPGCKHEDPAEGKRTYFNQRCHPGRPRVVTKADDDVIVFCCG